MTPQLRSGMVGLGNMGGRIARRVRDGGFPIVGFDADAAQASRAGVAPTTSLADVVAAVDVLFFSLPDSGVVEGVVYGDDGVLTTCRQGQVVVDLSTAAPSSSVRIHAAVG